MTLRDIVVEASSPLGLAFEFAAEPALVIDPRHDRIVDANARAASLLGYPREACVRCAPARSIPVRFRS